MTDSHEHWMMQALVQAEIAADRDEVPVGAVLVRDGELLGSGFNQPISSNDPTAHAEIMALREAAQKDHNYRLPGTCLYVTLEPCTMCIGALVHARVEHLVFGAREPRFGAVVSQQMLLRETSFNHHLGFTEGVLADDCANMLQSFFKSKRDAK
ncbi:MAG TPA: tRNA adenosine(34) deaminase TadA [Gammaproteobacteria bacterium]|nr:tRNA adenosine(34) deaminase TadA [Gammaproteobacteria bacterium]HJO11362.1 tRNA adenosine(34) deaminase TadA [Gammaproteobacteria bacterium]